MAVALLFRFADATQHNEEIQKRLQKDSDSSKTSKGTVLETGLLYNLL